MNAVPTPGNTGGGGGIPALRDHRIVVSVGMCAYNEASRISAVLDSLLGQSVPEPFELAEILVVASGCTDGTERIVEAWSEIDSRVRLLREPRRNGKASALNYVLQRYRGDLLVLLNADARLRPDSLGALLHAFLDDGVEIACGASSPGESRNGVTRLVHGLLWDLHNRTLWTLSRLGMPNHCCDEFMAIRRGFVEILPAVLINDGAYMGVLASCRGVSVRFCPRAEVVVETPQNLFGHLQQRRRILRGHRQIQRLLDFRPNTLRGIFTGHPEIAVRIVLEEVRRRPLGAFVLSLIAIPLEIWAGVLDLTDSLRGRVFDPAWPKVESIS